MELLKEIKKISKTSDTQTLFTIYLFNERLGKANMETIMDYLRTWKPSWTIFIMLKQKLKLSQFCFFSDSWVNRY